MTRRNREHFIIFTTTDVKWILVDQQWQIGLFLLSVCVRALFNEPNWHCDVTVESPYKQSWHQSKGPSILSGRCIAVTRMLHLTPTKLWFYTKMKITRVKLLFVIWCVKLTIVKLNQHLIPFGSGLKPPSEMCSKLVPWELPFVVKYGIDTAW